MPEIGSLLEQFTPGAYGVWAIAAMVALRLLAEWRETRKLTSADRLARREGYAKQVENLQGENRALRGEMALQRAEHDDYRHMCQTETDSLRQDVIRLEGELAGYKRRLDTELVYRARDGNDRSA